MAELQPIRCRFSYTLTTNKLRFIDSANCPILGTLCSLPALLLILLTCIMLS
jgi:hypothetical protein